MGLRYSLCSIHARKHSTHILRCLAPYLDDHSAQRLQSIDWYPEHETEQKTEFGTLAVNAHGIAGLIPEDDERPNDFCLSLKIKLEEDFHKHINPCCIDQSSGSVRFGCIWTSVSAGADFVLLQLMAATSQMSRIIAASQQVIEMWTSFARSANSACAYIDFESEHAKQLYPKVDSISVPDVESLGFCDDIDHYSIDDFARHLMSEEAYNNCVNRSGESGQI